ncbi:RagB/SusD family nutrient uptake outer membrane protein [Chryseobacterium kwangjuense]|uniref:RagB/SusD family nutrient uptake outer membrane protein n=1 Tax=Chryseobacterium kwangjuense TaxID=267125 RepID=A0A135WDK5_9FLAO|nr:RagB/SusD family nutrient uptake outer membrane protein [Chryseobacterium kwangjuense]KXH82986.1 hypothetical protein AU378_11150 [Chryseobacterium kwangjuense]
MKKIVLIIGLVASSFGMTSCSNDFLDDPKATDLVNEQVAFGSKEAITAVMAGIIRQSRSQYTNVDTANLGSIFFTRSLKGNDLIQANNWFGSDYEQINREPTYRRTLFSWQFPYELASRFTLFIEGVKASKADMTEEERNAFLAQGYAYRAYMYFQLSLEFQQTYSFNPDAPAPPIYTESGSLEGKPMSTMKQLYAFILSDLDKAVSLGSEDRIDKSYMNKEVAYALQAQVYQVMGDWPKAEAAAHNAYGGNALAVLNAGQYGNGFNEMNNDDWLFASPQSDEQSAYYYTAIFAFTDFTTTSYRTTYVNTDFVNLFSNTDVRRLFTKMPQTDWRSYTTTKFKFNFGSDIPLIRYPEMILIEAEAMLNNGKTAQAHDLLYALQKNRDAAAVKSTNTGAALLEEILVERRKELYGENGVEWYDAKRLRRGITRSANHRTPVSLTPDDKRFVLKVPQAEIDANPNIDESVNNGK